MLWTLINITQAIGAAFWTLIWVTVALLFLLATGKPNIALILARRAWAPGLLFLGGARLQVTGLEHLKHDLPYVFVANHESTLDIPAVFAALPENLHFILKKELFWVPFIGLFAWATGMIFVDRHNKNTAIRSLRRVGRIIRSGRSVMAFPEGTRNLGTIMPFKKGVFVAALEAGVPIVPIAIIGTAQVMPRSSLRIRPGQVQVRIGEPIETAGLSLADREKVMALAHQRVAGLYTAN